MNTKLRSIYFCTYFRHRNSQRRIRSLLQSSDERSPIHFRTIFFHRINLKELVHPKSSPNVEVWRNQQNEDFLIFEISSNWCQKASSSCWNSFSSSAVIFWKIYFNLFSYKPQTVLQLTSRFNLLLYKCVVIKINFKWIDFIEQWVDKNVLRSRAS